MTCSWITPCHRVPHVFYLGRFFCSFHARMIQGFRASRFGSQSGRDGGLLRPASGSNGAVLSDPLDGAAPPLTEEELFDILERDYYWREDVDL